jgi:fluoride ion exporter CrcB/FEX
MLSYLWVSIGGAMGSAARFRISVWLGRFSVWMINKP